MGSFKFNPIFKVNTTKTEEMLLLNIASKNIWIAALYANLVGKYTSPWMLFGSTNQ